MDEEEFENFVSAFEVAEPVSRKWHKQDILVLGLDLVCGVVSSVAETLTSARDIAAMNANYLVDQDTFAEQAALEIETLTNGETDG